MRAVIRVLRRAAPTDVPILISGEPGTGKRFFARTIHDLSPRSRNAFVLLDSSKTPAVHEADSPPSIMLCRETDPGGAFDNCLEGAKRGTLAIVEVSGLAAELQARLVPVLDEREWRASGNPIQASLDIRFLALSTMNWQEAVNRGRLLEQLYYRLKVFSIKLPPLRERVEDVPSLANHFIKIFAQRNQVVPPSVDQECLAALQTYPWPGNVAELRSVIQGALAQSHGRRVTLDDLPFKVASWRRGGRI